MTAVFTCNMCLEVVQSRPILAVYAHAWGGTSDTNVSSLLTHTRAGAVLTLTMPFEIVCRAKALRTVAAWFATHMRFGVSLYMLTTDYQHVERLTLDEQHLRSI
jgi:hypothetical protein